MKILAFGFAITLAIFAWHYANRPITYPPGILIASDPKQTSITEAPITCGDFTLQPLAYLALDARLLHLKIYRYDKQAALVPVDLALGWGPMSDQRVLDQITVTQSMRFYWFDYKQPPISKEEIIAHSTNMHIIPSTKAIASRCKSLRAGTLVHLEGNLVEASAPNYGTWHSSVSRTDTGNGACELIWLKEISVLTDLQTRSSLVTR